MTLHPLALLAADLVRNEEGARKTLEGSIVHLQSRYLATHGQALETVQNLERLGLIEVHRPRTWTVEQPRGTSVERVTQIGPGPVLKKMLGHAA